MPFLHVTICILAFKFVNLEQVGTLALTTNYISNFDDAFRITFIFALITSLIMNFICIFKNNVYFSDINALQRIIRLIIWSSLAFLILTRYYFINIFGIFSWLNWAGNGEAYLQYTLQVLNLFLIAQVLFCFCFLLP